MGESVDSETDPYILGVLNRTRFGGSDGRLFDAMRRAKTETAWMVILGEMIIAAGFHRREPKGLRPYVVAVFVRDCPYTQVLKSLHAKLPRARFGYGVHRDAARDDRYGRTDWRRYERRQRTQGSVGTIADGLTSEVRSKLMALRASLEPA